MLLKFSDVLQTIVLVIFLLFCFLFLFAEYSTEYEFSRTYFRTLLCMLVAFLHPCYEISRNTCNNSYSFLKKSAIPFIMIIWMKSNRFFIVRVQLVFAVLGTQGCYSSSRIWFHKIKLINNLGNLINFSPTSKN